MSNIVPTPTNYTDLYSTYPAFKNLVTQAGRIGISPNQLIKLNMGTPIVGDVDALIKAATSTELPNAETVTYTFPHASASPQDGVNLTGIMDVPRNITAAVTHSSSIVAMTILITGTDVYGVAMTELMTVVATGTSAAYNGKKAFKTVTSIAMTAVGDAEANTVGMGFGDVLGIPYVLTDESDVLGFYAGTTEEKLASVFVGAVATNPATNATGDTRGTVNPNTTLDGSVQLYLWMSVQDPSTIVGLAGVTQA